MQQYFGVLFAQRALLCFVLQIDLVRVRRASPRNSRRFSPMPRGAGECETKPILDAPDSQQSRDQLVSKIAHLHSAELVDWAQRSLPIKNMLTPTDCLACHLSLSGLRRSEEHTSELQSLRH